MSTEQKENFEQFFEAQSFFPKLKYIHGERLFDCDEIDGAITYRNLTVNACWATWQHQQAQTDEVTHLAIELAKYASYAEIIGAVSHNRSAIRKYCDDIFDFNKRVEAKLEESLRGNP